jgi:hypothetical protein
MTVNPKVAAEWDYVKNSGICPEDISGNSHVKAWWLCKKGHNWEAAVSNRNNGNGCPYCANKLVLKGFNDLLTVIPELCEEWDYEKNTNIQPDAITIRSDKKAYWKCVKGHSYHARIADRSNGSGCPVCVGKIVIQGENDLKTLRPDIADEWDYEKNMPLRPENVTVRGTANVWWRCKKGHSYKSRVDNRYGGTGCPYCAGNLPIVGETDLATVHPELLDEWDYGKNKSRTPTQYSSRSNMKVWWKCKEGHSWEAAICNRSLGYSCPYCVGKLAISGVNDAASLFPYLIDEWASNENNDVSLGQLLPQSSKRFWWKCRRGHRWKASVQSRVMGSGCPRCKGKVSRRTRLVK